MTLGVNHQEARFIFVLSQQTAECPSCSYLHCSRMLLVTSNSALPIQGQRFKGTASNAATRISPWISDTHTLCTDAPFQGCHVPLPQNPPALPVASLAPIQEVLLFQNQAALGMLLVYSTPYGSCVSLRCSATLAPSCEAQHC